MTTLALICFFCAAIPAGLLMANVVRYRRAPVAGRAAPRVSILIPARNEEANIGDCLQSVLRCPNPDLEVIVLDDHSTDRTGEIVRSIRDPRLRLLSSNPLPPGWCGKQHACQQLADAATRPYLVFLDADVRLGAGAVPRIVAFLERTGADLASGVPRQITLTFSEKLLIPLVHFILLGFLPFGFMRRFRHPAFAAGCGQLFAARAESYRRAGGHAAIKSSGHDGIQLPRAFRKAGFKTDLFDATDLAACRMYASGAEVWAGLAKNAREGIAKPSLILPFTFLFMFGQILPPLLFVWAFFSGAEAKALALLGVGMGASHAARAICTHRFGQSWLGALLHSLSVLAFLAIQWQAAYREWLGRPAYWKGRPQPRLAEAAAMLAVCATLLGAEPIELHDQHGSPRKVEFPAAKLTILTIADREGSKELEPWIRQLKEKLGDRVEFEGVADLSSVPRPLRGFVSKRFKNSYTYPIMLDWEGKVARRFKAREGDANIYLLSKKGESLKHAAGKVDSAAVQAIAELALANSKD